MNKYFLKFLSCAVGLIGFSNVLSCHAANDNLIFNLDERKANSYQQIVEDVASVLNIRWLFNHNLDAFEDWMRDLTWVKENNIIINIKLPNKINKIRDLEVLISSFKNTIIPYWQKNGNKSLQVIWS